jgi:hypothetical protein
VDARFDLDGSGGLIDFADFFVFADHFGERTTTSAQRWPQVPGQEPSGGESGIGRAR